MAKQEKYAVLSTTTKKAFVVEEKGLTKKQAQKVEKKLKGIWCGSSPGAVHKKIRGKKIPKTKHCYRLYTKLKKQSL